MVTVNGKDVRRSALEDVQTMLLTVKALQQAPVKKDEQPDIWLSRHCGLPQHLIQLTGHILAPLCGLLSLPAVQISTQTPSVLVVHPEPTHGVKPLIAAATSGHVYLQRGFQTMRSSCGPSSAWGISRPRQWSGQNAGNCQFLIKLAAVFLEAEIS